jgi:uncharacterized LabA/DUF88 family protein
MLAQRERIWNMSKAKSALKPVYIFVDNSNIWISGKEVAGKSRSNPVPSDYWYRIDYGKLLELVKGMRDLGDVPKLYGSEPPPVDTVWKRIQALGFTVTLFQRNIYNKEKGLDMRMGLDIAKLAFKVKSPATIAIVAGDADYEPVIKDMKEAGWEVEIWYWENAAGNIKKVANYFHSLNAHLGDIGYRGTPPRK